MLPGGSGLELLRRLKRNDIARELPVIMLTAKTAEDNVIQGLDVGADDYITKPFSPKELIARIKTLLRRSPGGTDKRACRWQRWCQTQRVAVSSSATSR
jgi:two-component system phosphate regulon response regulator PhoB